MFRNWLLEPSRTLATQIRYTSACDQSAGTIAVLAEANDRLLSAKEAAGLAARARGDVKAAIRNYLDSLRSTMEPCQVSFIEMHRDHVAGRTAPLAVIAAVKNACAAADHTLGPLLPSRAIPEKQRQELKSCRRMVQLTANTMTGMANLAARYATGHDPRERDNYRNLIKQFEEHASASKQVMLEMEALAR
jgi:hypothetical protein